MKKFVKLLSLLLCVSLLFGAALAEETETAVAQPADDAVIARLNGKDVTWGDASYYFNLYISYGYVDTANDLDVEWWKAKSMENAIDAAILMSKAEEFGFYPLSEEEAATVDAQLEGDWEAAMQSYISSNYPDLTDDSTDEEKAEANAAAEKYFADLGYTMETLREDYHKSNALNKLQEMMLQDATVTDEEIDEAYQTLVEQDKALYENDLKAYCDYQSQVQYSQMLAAYGYGTAMDAAAYRPAGFRGVKHILLPVDETLMTTYTDLQARYEEQENASEEAAAETTDAETAAEESADATPAPTAEPVTEEQVNEAKAAIFASLADKIDEINQKIADGADFDELIATYAVDAEGNATDPGMNSEPYKTNGYEVCEFSTDYVPEFVEAAMSIDTLGGVSAPYLSDYGVHIVKYVRDVPAGPIELSDADRETRRSELLSEKQRVLYNNVMTGWREEATIEYTGEVPTVAEVEAKETAAAEQALEEEADQNVETTAEPEATEEPAETADPQD